MKIRYRLTAVLSALIVGAIPGTTCGQTGTSSPMELPLPTVPATLRTPHERAAFVLDHFWDAMDFADTLRSRNAAFLEQNFANFASVLPHADTTAARTAAAALLRRAEQDSAGYRLLAEIVEKYLYEPDSPLYDEGCYRFFLDELLRTRQLDTYEKRRYAYQREAIAKNAPGARAADFEYLDREGRRRTLHGTPGERLLIVFYDPECLHCTEVLDRLRSDSVLQERIAAGTLTVLAVFADGERSTWQRSLDKIPAAWTAALDLTGIQEHDRYVLRDLPALYLLDRDKTVRLKAPSPETLHDYLSRP